MLQGVVVFFGEIEGLIFPHPLPFITRKTITLKLVGDRYLEILCKIIQSKYDS
jgi:hypothetical protein